MNANTKKNTSSLVTKHGPLLSNPNFPKPGPKIVSRFRFTGKYPGLLKNNQRNPYDERIIFVLQMIATLPLELKEPQREKKAFWGTAGARVFKGAVKQGMNQARKGRK